MNEKILVAYGTRCGSTGEVAQVIAEEFTRRGYAVDVRLVSEVAGLEGYSAVVIGTAVRYGQCLPETLKFAEQNQAALNKLPVAVFTMHLMNQGDDEVSRKARQAYLEPLRKLFTPKAEALFMGVGDPSKLSFVERMIGKAVKSPIGDFRDWAKIRAWAQTLSF
jgi:menaquinone-dependent protoporphyrinogen oxidase